MGRKTTAPRVRRPSPAPRKKADDAGGPAPRVRYSRAIARESAAQARAATAAT